jgi:RNA polymerase sigma-70 factor, ECF subfamily
MVLSLIRAAAPEPGPGPGPLADDAGLLRSVGRGDREAFAQLYRRHAPWLAGRLVRRAADPGLAEEALQDTFVAVWRRAGAFDGSGEAGAWLWGIAWRCLASAARRRRRRWTTRPSWP